MAARGARGTYRRSWSCGAGAAAAAAAEAAGAAGARAGRTASWRGRGLVGVRGAPGGRREGAGRSGRNALRRYASTRPRPTRPLPKRENDARRFFFAPAAYQRDRFETPNLFLLKLNQIIHKSTY